MIDFTKIHPCQIVKIRVENPILLFFRKLFRVDIETPNRYAIVYETRGQYLLAILRRRNLAFSLRLESFLDYDKKNSKRIVGIEDVSLSPRHREKVLLEIARDLRKEISGETSSNCELAANLSKVYHSRPSLEYTKEVLKKCQD